MEGEGLTPQTAPAQEVQTQEVPQQAAPEVKQPLTLHEIIEQRKLGGPAKTETPAEVPAEPEPAAPEAVPDTTALVKDQLYELLTNHPEQLISAIQAQLPQQAAPQQPIPPAAPEASAPQYAAPDAYKAERLQEASQLYASRPRITAAELFGDETADDLGLKGVDFSNTLEQFVQASVAPVIAQLVSDLYATQYNTIQGFGQVQPLMASVQAQNQQQQLAQELSTAFPDVISNEAARKFAETRYNDLAPHFMPPDLIKNPNSNPQEYARIAIGIAKIAATEFANLSPEQKGLQPTIKPASVTPEAQPIAPAYRNHLGQFNGNKVMTPEEASRISAANILKRLTE